MLHLRCLTGFWLRSWSLPNKLQVERRFTDCFWSYRWDCLLCMSQHRHNVVYHLEGKMHELILFRVRQMDISIFAVHFCHKILHVALGRSWNAKKIFGLINKTKKMFLILLFCANWSSLYSLYGFLLKGRNLL